MSVILSVLILGLVILIHEAGHFMAAKLSGITVLEFSLGMGPRLFSFCKGETLYSFKLLPFGGSCSMLGEEEENDEEGTTFESRSVWHRIAVIAGGPLFNFLLAFVLSLVLLGLTGISRDLVVLEAIPGYPAQEAGIREGDLIQKVNGRTIHSYRDFTIYLLTHKDRELKIQWKRTDETGQTVKMTAVIQPVPEEKTGKPQIGVRFQAGNEPVRNPFRLMLHAVYEVQFWMRYVLDSFYMMIHGLVSVSEISGPVGIVSAIDQTVEQAAPAGLLVVFLTLVQFTILLSSNLGVMNLLPLPALDGGRLMFLFLEALRGKPVDREREGMVHGAGMAVLLALMVLILLNDIRKLF